MIQVWLRAFTTVATVVVAVTVSAGLGDTAAGKIVAAMLIAGTVAAAEATLILAPKYSSLARRALDPRSRQVGVWLQVVKKVGGGASDEPKSEANRFAVYLVRFERPT